MDTLRAWERRYGFPKPERRPGSNRRLYSAADVERLVLVARALEAGYRVGDVIGKTQAELDALANPRRASATPERSRAFDVTRLVDLLAREDVKELEAELRHAAATLGAKRFVTELAHPFTVAVGSAWAAGRLAVRHEHLATECLTTQIRQLLSSYQDLDVRPLVLLATLPGEQHTLALQMVALYLAVSGAKPRLLGAETPALQLVDAARALDADVVGITITPSANRRLARDGIAVLERKLPEHVEVWVGGSGEAGLSFRSGRVRVVPTWSDLDAVLGAFGAGRTKS
jgi:DNA-binding transcriptional MerR regulator/methylmalonyl-CoA mutase cobalamin-binding subunit